MSKVITIEMVKQKALELGIECLSCVYLGATKRLFWKCGSGHIWEATYNNVINNGTRCKFCNGGALNHNIEELDSFVKIKYGGKCLSGEYKSNRASMKWKCKNGHSFVSKWYNVKNGYWCPDCGGSKRKTIKDMRNVAKENGGLCISKTYKNNRTKLIWECEFKHRWSDTYAHVQSDRWCPVCSCSAIQHKLYIIIRKMFKKEVLLDFKGFDWLKTSKYGKQEIDIWVPSVKLAVEYDGEQHFRPVCFGGMSLDKAKSNFKKAKKLDVRKNNVILLHKEDVSFFVRFNYKEEIEYNYVKEKLLKAGVFNGS